MRRVLAILTRPEEGLTATLLHEMRAIRDIRLEMMDLNVEQPDYDRLLDAVFESDSIHVW
ncbi:MAG TPA: hypothetical protein VMS21_12810 [Methylomirabilota bacterium]|nr:hypothetical protein [Methylomirabilota bacterium]